MNWNYDGHFGQAPMPRPPGSADRSPLFPSPGVAAQPYTICVRKLPRTFFLTSLVPLGPDENWFRTNAYNTVVVREWWGDDELGKAYCINCRKRAQVNYVMIVSGPNIQYVDIWDSIYGDDPLIRRFQNPSYLAMVGGFPVQMVKPSRDYMPAGQVTLALANGIGQDGLVAPSVELPVWNQGAQQWVVQDVTANGVVFDTEMGRVPLSAAAPGRGMLTLEEMAYICQFGQLRQAPNRGVSPFREVAAFGASEENCVKFYPLGKDGVCRIVCDGEDRGPCPSGWVSARPSPAPSRPMPTQTMRVLALNRGQFGSLCPPGTFETCTEGWKSDRKTGGVICKGWVCKTGRDPSKPWRNEWQSVRADLSRALYGPRVSSPGAPMGGVGSGAPGAPSFLPDVNGTMEPAMPEPVDVPVLPPEPIEYGSAEFPLPWPESCLPDPNACVENGIGVIPFDCEVDFLTGKIRCFGESSQFSGARFFLKPYFAYTPDGGTSLKYVVPEVDFGGRKWLYVEIPDLNLTGWAPLFEYGPDDKLSIFDL